MTEDPAARPVALGDHPGLPALLHTLPGLKVPVLPQDYVRIEQVFPAGHTLPWAEARDLLADLLAKDREQHQQVAEAFARFVPPPAAAPRDRPHSAPPVGGATTAGDLDGTTSGRAGATEPAIPRHHPIESEEPQPNRVLPLTILLALLPVVAAVLYFWPAEQIEQGKALEATAPVQTAPGALPSEPVARFHAWVPVVEVAPGPDGQPCGRRPCCW